MITVSLPEELEARLEELARRTGRTKEFYVREAILQYIEDLEDLALAEEEWENIRAGRSRTFTLEEVMKKHGVED